MKERIIDNTLALLGERGYSRFTMDLVATEMQISKRTLYRHFASKQQLLEASLTHWLQRKRLILNDGAPLLDRLCTLRDGLQHIDRPRVSHCFRELRRSDETLYRHLLNRLFDYADSCGIQAEQDATTGYLLRTVSRHTVSSLVSGFLVGLLGIGEESLRSRYGILSPDTLLLFARGLCTIKGRAHLEQRLKVRTYR